MGIDEHKATNKLNNAVNAAGNLLYRLYSVKFCGIGILNKAIYLMQIASYISFENAY